MTAGSAAATPSMPSHRLKARSNFPRRSRSIQRPSTATVTRTTTFPAATSAASIASTVSRMSTSGVFARADAPSNIMAIFIVSSVPASSSPGQRRARPAANEAAGAGGPFEGVDDDALAIGVVPQARLNELVVREARSASRLWKAGVVFRIREDARERIDLDDIRHAGGVEADIDARPVAAAEDAIGVEDHLLYLAAECFGDAGRALEDLERILRAVPEPLRLEPVDGD